MGAASAETMLGGEASSYRAIRRQLANALRQASPSDPHGGPSLEAWRITTAEPPRLAMAAVLEGDVIRRHVVPGDPEAGFAAFLDGIQASRVLIYDSAVPIVHGSVSAVVRRRDERRLTTWDHLAETRVYTPLAFLSPAAALTLKEFAIDVVDTTPRRADGEPDDDARHPLTVVDVAVHAVQGHREALERRLAERWCDGVGDGALYVDGGISGSPRLTSSSRAIGVVKSHRILYGIPAAVRTILSLEAGERSSVFTVASPDRWRSPVASWYLRLRGAAGHDPLWGLVRVEIAPPGSDGTVRVGAYADRISRWILAEAAPLSLPDNRWHTMVYGIRDCEQFLRSCQ